MTDLNESPDWGFHLNETLYSSLCPPCPKWAHSWEQQTWHKLGVVVWDTRVKRVTHLSGNQAFHILEQLRHSESWKKEGLLVGEVAYRIKIPSNRKSKSSVSDQPEPKSSKQDGLCLTNTIQLAPDQTQQFIHFLDQHEASVNKIIEEEEIQRRRILAQAYSLILSWGDAREKGNDSVQTDPVHEPKSVPSSPITIPHGKYLTIKQVAAVCGVKKRTGAEWLKSGLLNGLDLPGLGQIVEEKVLEKYLKEKRNQS